MDLHTFKDGAIDLWIEQESSIQLKSINKFDDPVEFAASEARALADQLKRFADLLDQLDNS
ncbi:hypothetical protein [Variovorax paradoxus]|uniref:hypothetical protein n=1 Tax=Variovorax paradoxus TaxID=34073 RepID=UPI000782D13F|nr:hypothetical protein [Variovorax paradoxus]